MVKLKEIKLKGLDQSLFYEKLKNGLEVYLIPFENKKNYIINYVTNFGSLKTEFIPIGKKEMITVPNGIAHFLEHKMFEQEDGIDPFTFASKTGTYSNASTNYDCTRYYFEGNKAFKENLEYLLNFVGSPYFTDENVEKEKGIIAEEIMQYEDEIGWFFDRELKKALLNNDNHRIDIGGTVDNIKKITKEELYDTYYTFYQPSNMYIVISGSFDKEEAINIIKNNKILNSAKTNFKIKTKDIKEDKHVHEKEVHKNFNITNPKVGYGIKIPLKNKDRLFIYPYLSIMRSVKFGGQSLFREKLNKDKIVSSFYTEVDFIDDYALLLFKAESTKPKELIKRIKKELENLDITLEELERLKKVFISSMVYASDNINETLENVVDDINIYGKYITDVVDITRNLNMKDYKKAINSLDLSNDSIVIIEPNK